MAEKIVIHGIVCELLQGSDYADYEVWELAGDGERYLIASERTRDAAIRSASGSLAFANTVCHVGPECPAKKFRRKSG